MAACHSSGAPTDRREASFEGERVTRGSKGGPLVGMKTMAGFGLSNHDAIARRGAGLKDELLEFSGTVIEKLPNAMFRVKLENDHVIIAQPKGRMRKFRIRVMVGDRVDVEMTPYDLTKGRITFRHK